MNNKDNYYEFDIIDQNTRSEIFGGKTYDKQDVSKKEEILEKNDPFKIKPIQIKKDAEEEQKQQAKVEDIDWLKSRNVATKIKPDEDDLTIKVYERKIEKEPEFKASFESFDDQTSEHQKEEKEIPRVVKPQQEIKTPKTFDSNKKAYILPSVSMFKKVQRDQNSKPQWLLDQIELIDQTLINHAVDGHVNGSTKGPTVTRYEIALEPGVNVKRVLAIQDNLMMNLAATSIRIEAPIPGKPYVGIEVANKEAEIVAFGNVVDQKEFLEDHDHPLKVALGVDIDGKNIYIDIAKMPHGLIAGGTGSGKSVSVNTILVSLLLKNTPENLKLILIDPKMVELTPYNDLPHLITPVITDPKMASSALNWAVEEMERRYKVFASSRSRDIKTYNENVQRGLTTEGHMPYMVIIIDELADLMMVAPHDVEDAIQRLTQKARAAGIHLLVATQRPTTDVVKGTIKSNIPARIAFKVASFVDSTTILDGAGAETLLGRGDMLLKEADRPIRLQGAYIPDSEIFEVTDFIRAQQEPSYVFKHEDLKRQVEFKETVTDDLFNDVALFVVREQNASINAICKEFNIGFNRAQKLVSLLEDYQIVSVGQGTKAREVLVTEYELEEILNK
ncbi:Cell division asociated protein, FtsK/SpoIIIE domain [Alteracholeplasma palmae J233]|uniref:Cell division asociated protein, FtsK/SpoIIIE domain n=2 Tax=Acholeplasma palmae TaxID=38986 RepID=U4KKD5_ALTPJ|nr:Cell division asociated protein, FtsK/SpoIIIE domain [Alteracholeplasma palmae J233]